MIHRTLTSLGLCCLLAVCSPVVRSQQKSASNEAEVAAERLREKAFALLESVAGQLGNLQSTENRARIGSNLVDAFWNRDERRARTILVAVESDIRTGLQNRVSQNRQDQQTIQVFLKLRLDTIERVAKHDAETALAFLKNTNVLSDAARRGTDSEQLLELRLAKQIAADNPDLALKIGREALEGNLRTDLLELLLKLQRKNSDKASLLYREIVAKLRQPNVRQNGQITFFARSLAASFTPSPADESTYRELIGLLINTAVNNGCVDKNSTNDEFCSVIASLLPQIERVDSGRAAQLRRWASYGEYWNYGPMYAEIEEAAATGTASDLLDAAKKYPQMRRQIYQRAVSKVLSSGDIEGARKIASEYDGDPEGRTLMLAEINQDQMWATLNGEKLAEVQRTLNTLSTVEDRLSYLGSLANRVGPTNPKAAVMLLDQANGIVDTMNSGLMQTQMRIALAIMYCLFKSERGFTIIESLIPKLNELIDAAAKLDGFDTSYLRDGEWNMSAEGNLGQTLTALSQNAGAFAWCDFDRAVSLAAQFERPEIRLMAQLKLAQGILAGQSKNLALMPPPRY